MPLHSQQTLHRISARLLPVLVLYILTDWTHLRLLLIPSALAFTIDLAVCVVHAVGAELRKSNFLAETRNQVVLRAFLATVLLIGEFASGELGLTSNAAFAVAVDGSEVHRTLQTVSAEALSSSTDVALHLQLTVVI